MLLYVLGGVAALAAAALAWWRVSEDSEEASGAPRLPPPEKPSNVRDATHVQGLKALREAWARLFPGEEPTPGAIQTLAGIASLEGSYGLGKYKNKDTGESVALNNWGAIQGNVVDPATGRVGGFLASDYNPVTGKDYVAYYQRYDSPASGAAALIKLVERYAPEALRKGHILRVSKQMYTGEALDPTRTVAKPLGYYQGVNRPKTNTPEGREEAGWKNIRAHAEKVHVEAAAAARASGEPLAAYREDLDYYLALAAKAAEKSGAA